MDPEELREWVNTILAKAPQCIEMLEEDLFYVVQPTMSPCWCCGQCRIVNVFIMFEGIDAFIKKHTLCVRPLMQEWCRYAPEDVGGGSDLTEECNYKDRDDAKCKGQS